MISTVVTALTASILTIVTASDFIVFSSIFLPLRLVMFLMQLLQLSLLQ